MHKVSAWFMAAAFTHALAAQQVDPSPPDVLPPGRVWTIPALAYGPDVWSVLRLANSSELPRSVNVDVYTQTGERLPVGPDYVLQPHQSLDIRIDKATRREEWCWARVVDRSDSPGELDVTAYLEILTGNQIADFPREARSISAEGMWAYRASQIQLKTVYFLNVFDHPTVVTFCQANKRERDQCGRKEDAPARFVVAPRQSIAVDVRRLRQRYFFVLSSAPGAALMVILKDGDGRRKTFSSESTIHFNPPPQGR